MLDFMLRGCLVLFMVGSLAGVGLGLTWREALAPLQHLRFVLVSLVASWILSPVLALLLLTAVPLAPPYATGLLLLALAPCAPFAPAMVERARGDTAYLAAFMMLSAVGTVIVMPFAVPRLVPGMPADALAIARPLVLFVLYPLIAGVAMRSWRPSAAARMRGPVTSIANLAGIVVLLLIAVPLGRGVIAAIGSYAIAAQVLFVGGTAVAAYLLGAGLAPDQRSALTIGVCTRNLGAALAPLTAVAHDRRSIVMIAIAAPVTIAVSVVAARWLARRRAVLSATAGAPRAAPS